MSITPPAPVGSLLKDKKIKPRPPAKNRIPVPTAAEVYARREAEAKQKAESFQPKTYSGDFKGAGMHMDFSEPAPTRKKKKTTRKTRVAKKKKPVARKPAARKRKKAAKRK